MSLVFSRVALNCGSATAKLRVRFTNLTKCSAAFSSFFRALGFKFTYKRLIFIFKHKRHCANNSSKRVQTCVTAKTFYKQIHLTQYIQTNIIEAFNSIRSALTYQLYEKHVKYVSEIQLTIRNYIYKKWLKG